jgi:hypothetical protein
MILGISHSKVPIYFRTGPEHPTPNNQHRTSNQRASGRQWMFDVGCWMLDVQGFLSEEAYGQVYAAAEKQSRMLSGLRNSLAATRPPTLNLQRSTRR